MWLEPIFEKKNKNKVYHIYLGEKQLALTNVLYIYQETNLLFYINTFYHFANENAWLDFTSANPAFLNTMQFNPKIS